MNAERRKRIDKIIKDIEALPSLDDLYTRFIENVQVLFDNYHAEVEQITSACSDIRDAIEEIKGEEQEGFDNLSEGLQQAERGQAMEMAVNALDSAYSKLEEVADYEPEMADFHAPPTIEDVVGELEEAASG